MGLVIGTAKLMLDEAKERPFYGSILQLGLQDLTFSKKQFFNIAKERAFDIKLDRLNKTTTSTNKTNNYISNSEFFTYIGFSEISSMDYSDYGGSNILFDLNSSDLPHHLHERFDFILDGGTLEHVFNLPQALSNIISMCKVGGRIMHISPSSNQVNHGFYSFSPTLFFDFYDSNKFIFHRFYLCRYSPSARALYTLDLMRERQFITNIIRLDSRIYYTICVVEKPQPVTHIVTPQQSAFQILWRKRMQAQRNLIEELNEDKIKNGFMSILHKFALFDLGKHIFIKYKRLILQLKLKKLR